MCIVGSCKLVRASSCTPLNIPNEEKIHYQENLGANIAYHPISKYGKIGVKQTWQPLPRYHLAISSQKWLFFSFYFFTKQLLISKLNHLQRRMLNSYCKTVFPSESCTKQSDYIKEVKYLTNEDKILTKDRAGFQICQKVLRNIMDLFSNFGLYYINSHS